MTNPRRVRTFIVLAMVAVALFGTASAAFLESDYPVKHKSVAPPRDPHYRPLPSPRPSTPVRENAAPRLLRQIEIGNPYRYNHLTIYPLNLTHGTVHSGLSTLDEALENGWIEISEGGRAVVSRVTMRNTSHHSIFLMAGEALNGGKQNRIISHDVILPPRSGFLEVPVYCVEQHRWSNSKGKFQSQKNLAHPALRRGAARSASQDSIWREVESRNKAAGVKAPTQNYESLYASPALKRGLDECLPNFRRFRGRETVGAVAVVGDRIVGADLFSDSNLFSKQWHKILRSYAVEYLSSPHRLDDNRGRRGHPAADVRGFLNSAITASYSSRSTPGAGALYRISGSANGETMIWNGHAVHVGLFGAGAISPLPPRPIRPLPEPRPMPRR